MCVYAVFSYHANTLLKTERRRRKRRRGETAAAPAAAACCFKGLGVIRWQAEFMELIFHGG